jgi:hypothetical protein
MPLVRSNRLRAVDVAWQEESKHQEQLQDFHKRLMSLGYAHQKSTPAGSVVRHEYRNEGAEYPRAIINEYGSKTPATNYSKASKVNHTMAFLKDSRVGDSVQEDLTAMRKKIALAETPEEEAKLRPEFERLMRAAREEARAKDVLPVSTDPSREAALRAHEEGLTKSQDRRKVSDGAFSVGDRLLTAEYPNAIGTVRRINAAGDLTIEWKTPPSKTLPFGLINLQFWPVSDHNLLKKAPGGARDMKARDASDTCTKCGKEIPYGDSLCAACKKKKTAKDELPTAIKPVDLVPMPAGQNNEVRYAPRRVGDALSEEELRWLKYYAQLSSSGLLKPLEKKNYLKLLERQKASDRKPTGDRLRTGDHMRGAIRPTTRGKARTGDVKATLPIQMSGSEPQDHLLRANQYEVTGDRARALDSYRAAATGYRKAGDSAGELKARDGITACQSVGYDQQYSHPGAGRVKVCDSAESAMRTAVERTRAGEDVVLDGKTVRPGRVTDVEVSYHFAEKPKKPAPILSVAEPADREKMKQGVQPYKAKDAIPPHPFVYDDDADDGSCADCDKGPKDPIHTTYKAKDDTGGPPPIDEPVESDVPAPVSVGDATDESYAEKSVKADKAAKADPRYKRLRAEYDTAMQKESELERTHAAPEAIKAQRRITGQLYKEQLTTYTALYDKGMKDSAHVTDVSPQCGACGKAVVSHTPVQARACLSKYDAVGKELQPV